MLIRYFRNYFDTILTLFLIALFAIGLWAVSADQSPQELPPLFESVSTPATAGDLPPSQVPVIRDRFVSVNPAQLLATEAQIDLPLFSDAMFSAQFVRADSNGLNDMVWVGEMPNLPNSDVELAVVDGTMMGTIHTGEDIYRIRPIEGDVHIIEELGAMNKIEGEPVPALPPAGFDAQAEMQAAADMATNDNGSVIDLLVVYTAAAKSSAGGQSGIDALISLAVSESNTGLESSGVTHRYNLAGTHETDYVESGNIGSDLSAIQSTFDGAMDDVHDIRNLYAADLVVLIIDGARTNYCGLAYLMTSPGTYFSSSGFSVVAHDCATGYYSFGHEIGHNMGNHHDQSNAFGSGAYSYSYGYQDPENQFRTVMAYNCSPYCTRVNRYSNPDIDYQSYGPTGVENQADNSRSMDNTALIVSGFRESSTAATPTPLPTATFTPTPTASPTPLPTVVATVEPAATADISAGNTSINVPSGVFSDTVELVYEAVSSADLPATPIPPLNTTEYNFSFEAEFVNGRAPAGMAGGAFSVSIQYSTNSFDHAMIARGIADITDASTLKLYYWDTDQQRWVEEVSSSVNTGTNEISATADQFGTWAVFGEGPIDLYLPMITR